MAQHEQFGVLRRGGAGEQHQPAREPDEDQVEQPQRHGSRSSRRHCAAHRRRPQTRADFWHPTGQPEHQVPDRLAGPRPARSAGRVGPTPGDQLAVPAQHGLGHRREDWPSRAWQQPGQGRQQQPVPALVAWPGHLPAQHCQFVPQNKNLHLVARLGTGRAAPPTPAPYGRVGTPPTRSRTRCWRTQKPRSTGQSTFSSLTRHLGVQRRGTALGRAVTDGWPTSARPDGSLSSSTNSLPQWRGQRIWPEVARQRRGDRLALRSA